MGIDFNSALIGLEKCASKLDESTNAKSLNKAYRLYGMDKYVTCKIDR